MDELPRNDANKVLRISLAERLGLHSVDERCPQWERLFEAECPERGTNQRTPIPAKPVEIDLAQVCAVVADAIPHREHHVWQSGGTVRLAVTGLSTTTEILEGRLRKELPEYLVPRHILQLTNIPINSNREPDEEALNEAVIRSAPDHSWDALELLLYEKWSDLLETSQIGRDDDFFELGGSSILAVQLAAELRRLLQVPIESTALFRHRTITKLATALGEMRASHHTRPLLQHTAGQASQPSNSSVSLATLAVQAIPILAFFPLRRVFGWLLFIILWVNCFQALNMSRTASLLTALLLTGGIIGLTFPILGILGKWMIVGRYRRSRYALFGTDYLRWWLVRQWLSFTGLGLFQASYAGTAVYYRLLGAKVGKRTRILSDAILGEADLLTIGDDVCIDSQAVIRPFSIESGTMELKPIMIGSRSTIGMRAVVSPGCTLTPDHHVAPGSLVESGEPDTASGNAGLCRPCSLYPALPWRMAARLLVAGNLLLSWLPFYAFLLFVEPLPSLLSWQTVAGWFLLPEKMSVYLLMRITMAVLSPFLYFAGVVLIKRLIIGTFKEGPGQDKPIPQFRRYLMWRLLPDGTFGGLGPLLGSNFSMITNLYRLLGANVGDRIYWPGSGHHLIEYDLFVCGDDVTFGSRSMLLSCDGKVAKRITIEDGATVADRCFLAPGTKVQRNAVLGSGTTTLPDFVAPPGSTWIGFDGTGPIEVEAGQPQRANASTSRPFGRALRSGSPAYWVWPSIAHALLNNCVVAGATVYRSLLLLVALAFAFPLSEGHNIGVFGCLLLVSFAILHAVFALAALVQTVLVKWTLVGQRTVGKHPWDVSSYCQRWKIHQAFERIHQHWFGRRALLDMLGGTAYLAWFLRAQGASIGRNTCLFPNGADPLPTEPDLLTIKEGAAIDRAILVCHLNTRGEWELGPVTLGANTTLQTGSRVMLQGIVEDHACLRQHTLVLSGETVDARSTWRGWPGRPDMLTNTGTTRNSRANDAHSESTNKSPVKVDSEQRHEKDPHTCRSARGYESPAFMKRRGLLASITPSTPSNDEPREPIPKPSLRRENTENATNTKNVG
ncbi:MAG: phosphopantetheine-binding protein [Planctomycetota bacterium]